MGIILNHVVDDYRISLCTCILVFLLQFHLSLGPCGAYSDFISDRGKFLWIHVVEGIGICKKICHCT